MLKVYYDDGDKKITVHFSALRLSNGSYIYTVVKIQLLHTTKV